MKHREFLEYIKSHPELIDRHTKNMIKEGFSQIYKLVLFDDEQESDIEKISESLHVEGDSYEK